MKRAVWWLIALGFAAGAVVGIRAAHEKYASLWLTGYLILVALPLVLTPVRIAMGAQRIHDLLRGLFTTLLGLLLLTLMYQYVTENWIWAVLAALVGVGVVSTARQWAVLTAQTRLAQANQLLESGRTTEALKIGLEVRAVLVARGNRQGQAVAERLIGVAYARQGDNLRSARYLNSALALFKATNQQEQTKQVQKDLAALQARGVDVHASAVTAEVGEEVGRIDWGFLLDGALSIAFLLALLVLWKVVVHASPLILIGLAVLLLLLFYGNYAVGALASRREGRAAGPYLVFNLALLLLALGGVALALRGGAVEPGGLPDALRGAAERLGTAAVGWPGWAIPAAAGIALLLMLLALVWASGRSPAGFLKILARGDVTRQALQLATGHLDAGEWREAITQLTRISLPDVKDPARRKEILFGLAYASHRAERPAEARQYLGELLAEDARHPEGLYLAGYQALKEGNLDEAERAWRALAQAAPRYVPPGASPEQSGAYYLALTLYRRAMEVIDRDLEKGAALLAEASATGALDREVADALVRVHLYQAVGQIRQRRPDVAARELEAARAKVSHLKEGPQTTKLTGLCQAGLGLVALKREQHAEAAKAFAQAIDDTKNLAPKLDLPGGGNSLLEQLLRLVAQETEKDSADRISRSFARDLHFLGAVAALHQAHDKVAQVRAGSTAAARQRARKELVAEVLTRVRPGLEKSVSMHPDFLEGRTLLGLIYYHLGADKAQRDKGFEILEAIRKRVGSRYVAETVEAHEKEVQRKKDARQAYFDLLQQYLRSSTVPREQREALRQQVLADMKQSGELEGFLGQGSLEIDTERDREPTVREYAARVKLLAAKLEELRQRAAEGQLPPDVERLMQTLEQHNQELNARMRSIAEVERELLLKAQALL